MLIFALSVGRTAVSLYTTSKTKLILNMQKHILIFLKQEEKSCGFKHPLWVRFPFYPLSALKGLKKQQKKKNGCLAPVQLNSDRF